MQLLRREGRGTRDVRGEGPDRSSEAQEELGHHHGSRGDGVDPKGGAIRGISFLYHIPLEVRYEGTVR